MRHILAFGDSLTWGADPETGLRHPWSSQWPVVLEAGLTAAGCAARVHCDGIGGRTTCRDDDAGAAPRNGAKALPLALGAHMPLDLVMVMLGTNDLKPVHGGRALSAQAGMRRLAQIVADFPYKPRNARPKFMIVTPPPCGASAAGGRSRAESQLLAPLYAALASEIGCEVFDAGQVARASACDGVHLSAEETAAIGRALIAPVCKILG